MPKYTFDPWDVVLWPDEDLIRRAILQDAGNDDATTYKDINGFIIVDCENRPRDLLAHGVRWYRLQEEDYE